MRTDYTYEIKITANGYEGFTLHGFKPLESWGIHKIILKKHHEAN
jgi:hypothetical protein